MLRTRQRFGKYIIQCRLAEGGFAAVYRAMDTIEGVRVALKVPHPHLMTDSMLTTFKHEARLAAKLDHPNILQLKNADFIDGKFVLVTPLSETSLESRLQKRLATRTALDYSLQLLEAVSYAHEHKVVHCDIKPDNLLLFPENQLQLADFGIARVAHRTLQCSGSGTLGYVAPEQAMGKPSFRSDVFSMGIVIYRMLTGVLPEWPYQWPLQGFSRLKDRVTEPMVTLLRRATSADCSDRYANAGQMLTAFRRIKKPLVSEMGKSSKSSKSTKRSGGSDGGHRWQLLRRQEFQKEYGKILETRCSCSKCAGPVSEAMLACPWCGTDRKVLPDVTRFPICCPRCNRGLKADWPYCPWCYGTGFELETKRTYTDRRYTARCTNKKCTRKSLMPFMRYCCWCRHRVKRKWKIENSPHTCHGCGWGIVSEYWSFCPWCETRTRDN